MSEPLAGRPLRIVPDTNLLVSALLQPRGTAGAVLRAWRDGQVQFVICPELLAELADVLSRPKLRARIAAEQAAAFVTLLRSECELRADPEVPCSLTPDPEDDFIVALALTARVDHVVSGDQHLTATGGPLVLTPAAFVELLEGHSWRRP